MKRTINTGISAFDGGMMCIIKNCDRNNSCRSCDDEKCRFAGDMMADCPRWTCNNGYNCTKCEFIDSYIKEIYGGDRMSDLIRRQDAINEAIKDGAYGYISVEELTRLPSAESDDWLEKNKDLILQAGMEGREVEFRMEGRLFAIREKAQ